MARIGLLILLVYAATGFVLSLAANLLTYAGIRSGGEGAFYALGVGIFPVWAVVCFIQMKLMGGMRVPNSIFGGDYRKIMFPDGPRWLRYAFHGLSIYAFANFIFLFPALPTLKGGVDGPPIEIWRAFTAVWMIFYAGSVWMLLTAYRRGPNNFHRQCINGHDLGLGDRFCSECGAPVTEQA